MPCWSTHGARFPVQVDRESNPSMDDAETTSAYLTAVYQQPVVGEERIAPAGFGPVGRNPESTKHGYVEGLGCL